MIHGHCDSCGCKVEWFDGDTSNLCSDCYARRTIKKRLSDLEAHVERIETILRKWEDAPPWKELKNGDLEKEVKFLSELVALKERLAELEKACPPRPVYVPYYAPTVPCRNPWESPFYSSPSTTPYYGSVTSGEGK